MTGDYIIFTYIHLVKDPHIAITCGDTKQCSKSKIQRDMTKQEQSKNRDRIRCRGG